MKAQPSAAALAALRPLSLVWAGAARARNFFFDHGLIRIHRVPAPVVSFGNITVGGTGKTPLAIHLSRRLIEEGLRPVVLSRGYGSNGRGTRIVSDGAAILLGPVEAGDEPVLIARSVPGLPVVVDPDRVRGAREAILRFAPSVLLLDDGFQHRRLARDLDIVLLDAHDPFGRYALLPAGLLREPFSGLSRSDLFVLTHAPREEPLSTLTSVLRRFNDRAPILRASHVPAGIESLSGPDPPPTLSEARVFGFCAIGNPEGFRSTLLDAGARISGFSAFRDHHRFGPGEIASIAAEARDAGAEYVVTTQKDAIRLASPPPATPPFLSLGIRMEIDREDEIFDRIFRLARGGVRSRESV